MGADDIILVDSYGKIGTERTDIKNIYVLLDDYNNYKCVYVTYNNGRVEKAPRGETSLPYDILKESINDFLYTAGATYDNINSVWYMTRKNGSAIDYDRLERENQIQTNFRNRVEKCLNTRIGDESKNIKKIYISIKDDGTYDTIYIILNDGTIERISNINDQIPYLYYSDVVRFLLETVGAVEENKNKKWFMLGKTNSLGIDFTTLDEQYSKQAEFNRKIQSLSNDKFGDDDRDINHIYIKKTDKTNVTIDVIYLMYNNGRIEVFERDGSIPDDFYIEKMGMFLQSLGIDETNRDVLWSIDKKGKNSSIDFYSLDCSYYNQKQQQNQIDKIVKSKFGNGNDDIQNVYIQRDFNDKYLNVFIVYNDGKIRRISNPKDKVPYGVFADNVARLLVSIGANDSNKNDKWFEGIIGDEFGVDFNKLNEEYYRQEEQYKLKLKELNRYTVKDVIKLNSEDITKIVAGRIFYLASALTLLPTIIHFGGLGIITGLAGLTSALVTELYYGRKLRKEKAELMELNAYELGIDLEDSKINKR